MLQQVYNTTRVQQANDKSTASLYDTVVNYTIVKYTIVKKTHEKFFRVLIPLKNLLIKIQSSRYFRRAGCCSGGCVLLPWSFYKRNF